MAEIAQGRPEAHGEIRARATVEIVETMALLGDASSTSREIVDGIDRAIDKAMEAEREACAQIADDARRGGNPEGAADAIRARGSK